MIVNLVNTYTKADILSRPIPFIPLSIWQCNYILSFLTYIKFLRTVKYTGMPVTLYNKNRRLSPPVLQSTYGRIIVCFKFSITNFTVAVKPYSIILATTPEPTVLPPSLIANLSPSSIAIGVISSISICTLSPGMHISVPSGNFRSPVTSVVLK